MSLREEMRSWDGSTVVGFWAGVVGLWAVTSLAVGTQAWAHMVGQEVPLNPWRLVAGLGTGSLEPTAGMVACVAAAGVGLVAVPVAAARLVRRGRGRSTRVDRAARLTGRTADTRVLGAKAAAAKARRLGVPGGWFGLPVGRAVGSLRWLVSGLEDVCLIIAGTRRGKTTSWVVPRIHAACGAVVATSNKPDIVTATREQRQKAGPVWVFDPQGLADTSQEFWWNPLSYVVDAVTARALVQVFVDATRDANAQTSAYFDSAARDLVAAMLLAAARAGEPMTVLHRWLNSPTDKEPVRILRRSGEEMSAETLEGTINLVPETRSGVYGSAATIMSFMLNDAAMRWVTPQPGLPELDPAELVRSTGTLYCLSQEGRGSAAPVVTALTVAVTEAAVAWAKTQPGGRMPTPMLIELDEAANVCRWRELPDMYSHFGSRGIVVDTILQTWSQGVTAWGEAGMRKLWSAANVAVYAGGVKEKGFLAELSELIGPHWVDSHQSSFSQQGTSRTVSRASQQRSIATVADLQALPDFRAWVLASGATPVLAELVPFWERRPEGLGTGRTR